MEDKHNKKKDVKDSILMEGWKPRGPFDFTHQGITGEDFQPYQNEKQRAAESNKIVRKHHLITIANCKIIN
jgi:hypothetical protein